jgi:cell division septation protein DedD
MSPRLETDHDERDAARDEPRRRGQGVRAALLALAVAALVGGSWWAGHRSSPANQDMNAVPEIHADNTPVKEAPKERGGLVVPDQDSVLLNRDEKAKPDDKAKTPEELLPPPETVKPRPAQASPPPRSDAANMSTQPAAAPAPDAKGAPSVASATPAPLVATAPPAPEAPSTAVAPKAAAPIGGPVPKVAPLSPPAPGAYRLQLGALKTEEAAKAEWLKLQRQNSDVLGKLSLSVSRVDLGAKGAYYRIQAGPVADEAKAAEDCTALKSRKVGCILVKP